MAWRHVGLQPLITRGCSLWSRGVDYAVPLSLNQRRGGAEDLVREQVVHRAERREAQRRIL